MACLLRVLVAGAACGIALLSGEATGHAFSTRVHITLANEVRDALIEGGGRDIKLRYSGATVRLREEDARAIVQYPLAFRAGSIGPDNMIFPGMTDPSHAVGQKPFEQCELLYKAVTSDEERAYALGCFMHGSTDAIGHHYVNYLAGETFTLAPLASGRKQEFSNVIRHIAAESMVEDALLRADPNVFGNGALTHTIPVAFVQRAYFDQDNALYGVLAAQSRARYTKARAARPTGRLNDILAVSDLQPADHLVLAPLYFDWVDETLSALHGRFKSLQDWNTTDGARLHVTAGADGKIGTTDDQTACTTGCAPLYGEYALYTYLMAPRFDAQGRQMKSAFEKVTGKVHDDLRGFVPAYLKTVDTLSSKLNTPYRPGEKKVDIDSVDVQEIFRPLQDWGGSVASLDYDAIARAVIPDVWVDFAQKLRVLGITVPGVELLRRMIGPIVAEIEKVVQDFVVAQGKEYFRSYTAAYKEKYVAAKAEYADRLKAAAPAGGPTVLEDLRGSGLYGHAFNVAVAALADHSAVLPEASNDPVGIGAASFDTSYSMQWMQVGLCEPLRKRVLPLGLGIKGLLSIHQDGKVLEANVTDEARVECHDGSLADFSAAPNQASCAVVTLDALMKDTRHRGSLTRGYPPELATAAPICQGAGTPAWLSRDGEDGSDEDDARLRRTTETSGCGIGGAPGASAGTAGAAAAVLGFLVLLLRSRRRRAGGATTAAAALTLSLATFGCGVTTTTVEEEIIPGSRTPGDDANDDGSGAEPPGDPLPPGLSTEAKALLTKLGTSVWHGTGTRNGKARALELHFAASRLQWGEVQNPFGPGRRRELKAFTLKADNTLHAVVTNPGSWTDGTNSRGEADYAIEVVAGTPRTLKVTSGGKTETFTEGAEPAPTGGLTATVRTFASGGIVDNAFCGASYFSGFNYTAMLNFARAGSTKSVEHELGADFVVGAKLAEWSDTSGANRFSVQDVPGFDRLGGTDLTDQQNFFVHYTGKLKHPGGTFRLREYDDVVGDGVWSFLGPQVGSTLASDLFLEVHSRPWADTTYDVGVKAMPTGSVPIEIIVARCAATIKTVTLQGQVDSGPWVTFDSIPTEPLLDPGLLAPPL